ncbi:hypothetical protein MASR2M16_24950 [Thauera terpenica]
MLHEGSVGAKVFLEFLKRLMVNAEKPAFLIVDAHKAKRVKSYVDGLQGKLKVSRQLIQSAEDMKRLALGASRSIQKLPELVKSLSLKQEGRNNFAS